MLFDVGKYFFVQEVRHENSLDYCIEVHIYPESYAEILSFDRVSQNGDIYTYEGEVEILNEGNKEKKFFRYQIDTDFFNEKHKVDFIEEKTETFSH